MVQVTELRAALDEGRTAAGEVGALLAARDRELGQAAERLADREREVAQVGACLH